MIGRVELGSTFPTITISPTTTDFNGNACLGWSAAIGDIPLFLLKHVSVTAQLELRKMFAAIFAPNTSSWDSWSAIANNYMETLVCGICDSSIADGRRPSPTVTDHMGTRL